MSDQKKEMTVDNIDQIIKDGATITKEIAENSAKKLAEKQKEKLTERHMHTVQESKYKRALALLRLRKAREVEKTTKEYLVSLSKADENLKSGAITIDAWNEELIRIADVKRKANREIDNNHSKNVDALNNQFEGYSTWRWSNDN